MREVNTEGFKLSCTFIHHHRYYFYKEEEKNICQSHAVFYSPLFLTLNINLSVATALFFFLIPRQIDFCGRWIEYSSRETLQNGNANQSFHFMRKHLVTGSLHFNTPKTLTNRANLLNTQQTHHKSIKMYCLMVNPYCLIPNNAIFYCFLSV